MPSAKLATQQPLPSGSDWALDAHLCFALYSSSLAMSRVYRPLLAKVALSYPQYLVMRCLWEKDAQIVSELGALLFLDSGTLTPLLKRLETMGLVERERSLADERRVCISLTSVGKKLRARTAAWPECLVAATGCQPQAIDELTAQLQGLRSNLLASLGEQPPVSR